MKVFKYRITTDAYAGYELQHKFILFPFWRSMYKTFKSIEDAEQFYIKHYNKKVIKELN